MDDGQPTDKEEPTISQEQEGNGLDWLLRTDSSEIIPAPMDTNVLLAR